MDAELRQTLVAYLRSKRSKVTPRRMAIIEAAFEHQEPFTGEQLLIWSRRRDPRISRATVHRTIPLLLEGGYLKERNNGTGVVSYAPNFCQSVGRCHILCQDCGRIVEFDHDAINQALGTVVSRAGLEPITKTVKVEASCRQLRQEGNCEFYRPLAETTRARTPKMASLI